MILAGGASRRFGSDKCFADWHGTPFLRRVADALKAVSNQLLILGRSDVPAARYHAVVPEARVRTDLEPQAGAVAAFRNVMGDLRTDWVLVAPCDAPGLEPAHIQLLANAARIAKGIAVATTDQGVLYDLFCAPRPALESRMRDARRWEDIVAEARQVRLEGALGLNVNEPM